MRWITYAVCLCVVVIQLNHAMPTPDEAQEVARETLQTIDRELGKPTAESSIREKRTVGVFRRIFPEISKMIDDKIQQLTSIIFRVVGSAVLRGGLGGGGGGGGGGGDSSNGDGDSGRRVSIVLPTYPPEEYDDEEETEEPSSTSAQGDANEDNVIPGKGEEEGSGAKKRSLVLDKKGVGKSVATNSFLQTQKRVEIRSTLSPLFHSGQVKQEKGEEGARENALPEEAASEVKEVRVPYVPPQSENDLQAAATGGDNEEAESSQEEVSDDIDISETEENSRSKRLGVFGNLLGGFGGNGGSSGGGSGNFLFDIIRRTADGAARAAGSVYRLVAGTDDLGLTGYDNDLVVPTGMPSRSNTTSTPRPSTTTTTSTTTAATLVAGSGATEQQDENANSPLAPTGSDQPLPADDGYQAGIPGPITRLFVIANRGIANLMQDLILRLAQTSERIVNFKARLITAII